MRTFVLRIRSGAQRDTESRQLRGVVDDVATGARTTFTSEDELLQALREAADPAPSDSEPNQEDS